MKKYIKYFIYVMEHKYNVMKACFKRGLYVHGITHDLSKLRPSEFIPYAEFFYGDYKNLEDGLEKDKIKEKFDNAFIKHYKRNKHHWNYWVEDGFFCKKMPYKYLMQMICDWESMSMKFGGTPQKFYIQNYFKIKLHWETRIMLERILGFDSIINTNKDYLLVDFLNSHIGEAIDRINEEIKEKFDVDCYKELNIKR